jgi:enamine deaminase RidA (YjgF/YER057c/UK114 family)
VASEAPGASLREQTINALENITRLLEAVGSHPTRIVSATIWLADIATFDEMNAVWTAGCLTIIRRRARLRRRTWRALNTLWKSGSSRRWRDPSV